jgi:hypothetical protein
LQDDNNVRFEKFFPYLNANTALSLLPNEATRKKFHGDIEKLRLNYLCFMGEANRDLYIKKGRKQKLFC